MSTHDEPQIRATQTSQAIEHIRRTFHHGPADKPHPLIQLISLALKEDGTVNIDPPPEIPISWKNWDTWMYLSDVSEEALIEALLFVMDREASPAPENSEDLAYWAAGKVELTLDFLDELE